MFFSFSLYMHLMIFRGSDPPKGSAECTTLTTTDRKVITVSNGGREISFPFRWLVLLYVAHALVYIHDVII
jgi:hypothetical protein